MNAPRDLRVEEELLSGAGPGDGGARGEPKEGGSL